MPLVSRTRGADGAKHSASGQALPPIGLAVHLPWAPPIGRSAVAAMNVINIAGLIPSELDIGQSHVPRFDRLTN